MGKFGPGIFENDSACNRLNEILRRLCLDLEYDLEAVERAKWYPDEAIAVAYILNQTAKIRNEVYCSCDAKNWRIRIEKVLRTFGKVHCSGDERLDYEEAETALNLFDDLISNSYAFDQDESCDCGGRMSEFYQSRKEAYEAASLQL